MQLICPAWSICSVLMTTRNAVYPAERPALGRDDALGC